MESSPNLTEDDIKTCSTRLGEYFVKFLEISNNELKTHGLSQSVLVYYSYVIQYNLQGGKLLRGTLVLCTIKALRGDDIPEQMWSQALTVAWCVELLQTAFLVADDIMDQSTKRRSNTCWYLVPTIGVANAINDAMFLYTLIYRILFKTMRDHKNFLEILESFNRVSMTTILGQHMDTYESKNEVLFEDSNEAVSLFGEICKNKTSYYSFYLPIKLGMILSDVDQNNLMYSRVESLSMLLGALFQAHDDYLDCYGDPEKSGKNGTDIQTRKCSWLLVQALTVATEDQKRVIRENIGYDDKEKVAAVKGVYDQLELDKAFMNYAKDVEDEIGRSIDQIENQGVKSVLSWCLGLIRGRMSG